MLRYAGVGVEFIGAFAVGVALGLYVDSKTGGGTIWTLAGGAAGFALGMYQIVRVAKEYRRESEGKDSP